MGLIAVIAPATGLYSLPYVAHDVADGTSAGAMGRMDVQNTA